MPRFLCFLTALAALAVTCTPVYAAPITYTDPVAFTQAANVCKQGPLILEGFESAAWDGVRWPLFGEAPLVTSQGVDWMSNVPGDPITTHNTAEAARDGTWGAFSRMHGQAFPLPSIFDGIRVESDGMCAFGTWVRTNTLTNRVGFVINDVFETGTVTAIVDFDWHFIGVVEPGGFFNIEVTEFDGDQGEPKWYFFDTVTIAAPEPTFASGLIAGVLGLVVAGSRKRNT